MAQFLISAFADEAAPDLAGQIAALKRNHLAYLEIRNMDGACAIDLPEERLISIAQTLKENGISVSSVGSPIGKYNITDDFAPHFERFKKAVRAAEIFGAKRIRLFSFFIPDGEDSHKYMDEVLSRMNALLDYVDDKGIFLCHENEARIFGCTPQACLELQEKLPRLKCVFDPANYILENADIPWAIDHMAPYLEYVHVKDACIEDHSIVPAGFGDGRIAEVLEKAAIARGDQDTFLTLEPHLRAFTGYSNIDKRTLKHRFSYADQNESFDAAVTALKNILTDLGYTEGDQFKWIK